MLKKLKEKLESTANSNTFVKNLNKFLESKWYLIAFATFVFIVQAFGLEVLGFITIALLFAYVSFFMPSTNANIPVICFATFLTSTMHSPAEKASGYEIIEAGKFVVSEGSQFFSSPVFLVGLIISIVIVAVALLYRMIVYDDYKKLRTKKTLLWGLVALAVAYLLSGIGYKHYTFDDFIMSFVQAVGLVALYFYVVTTADLKKFGFDELAHFCIVVLFYIMVLVAYIYATRFGGFLRFTGAWKAYMLCGWGMSNDFGIFLAMLLPAFFYKMYNAQKHAYVWYIFACLDMVVMFFTYARGAILVGCAVFAVGSIYAMIRKQNRKQSVISVATAFVTFVGVVAILHFTGALEYIMEYHISKVSNGTEFENISSGRADIWKRYFEYFTSNPIFGGGFTVDKIFYVENGMEVANGAFSAYSYFAHNTLFQILGSCGIVGLMAFLYHTLTTVIIYFKKPTEKRFIFAFSVFGFVAMAMLDVVFFKPYFVFYYALILIVCEFDAKTRVESQKSDEIKEKEVCTNQE